MAFTKWNSPNRSAILKYRYGITAEQYDILLETQNEVCAICERPETRKHKYGEKPANLSIDHDHETGRVRGLLCYNCNITLGMVDDDKEVLKKMINYLERGTQNA